MTGVSVRKRSVAMVYQQFINYPSLSVYDNIASPLKLSRHAKKEIDAVFAKSPACSIWRRCWTAFPPNSPAVSSSGPPLPAPW